MRHMMKRVFALLLMVVVGACSNSNPPPAVPVEREVGFECKPAGEYATENGVGKRFDCPVKVADRREAKTFHVLSLRGSFQETAEQQGYLMAVEADRGPMRQIIETIEGTLQKGSGPLQGAKKQFIQCIVNKMEASSSHEFVEAVERFYAGYKKRFVEESDLTPLLNGKGAAPDRDRLMMASLAIDLDNVVDAIKYRMSHGLLSKSSTLFELAKSCGKDFAESLPSLLLDYVPLKQGCTGFVSPAASSKENQFIHARNLDADLVNTWNVAPTLFLVHETGYEPYVSAAAGGLVYAGGISGYNRQKITTSLHQMSPTVFGFDYKKGTASIAPFIQQQILRKAKSVEEAEEIIENFQHFGSWTMLVGDAKNQKVLSTEFSAKRVATPRRVTNAPLVQTNHFLSPHMHYDAYKPKYNNLLETKARKQSVEEAIAAAFTQIDLTFAINQMASHKDLYEGIRSFGKTPVKPYGVMTTIAIPSKNQFWVTLGERTPASHSTYIGFEIDLENLTAKPLTQKRVGLYRETLNWERSLSTYISARESYNAGSSAKSVELLQQAISEAQVDAAKFKTLPYLSYHFMKARVLEDSGEVKKALEEWNYLASAEIRKQMFNYQQALVLLYQVRTATNLGVSLADGGQKLEEARNILTELQKKEPHPDLDKKLEMVEKLQKGTPVTKGFSLDFVAIE